MTAFEEIKSCINSQKSFVLEAGAGSGKTYTLIQTLRYLIENESEDLAKNKQKIICITYTNVAKNEIIERIEYNELVNVFTIHEFLWKSINQYQKQLKIELCKLNEIRFEKNQAKGKTSKYIPNLLERIANIDSVSYNDSSFRDFENGELDHDDVIELSKMIYENYSLISAIISQKYPYIFIDEYQDTAVDTIELLMDNLLNKSENKMVLGFYGDSHQKIYDTGVGDLEKYYLEGNSVLKLIKKEENYRSSTEVVRLLNNFRTNIQQVPQKEIEGSVMFLYWKNHPIKNKQEKIRDFENSLKSFKNSFYDSVILKLQKNGWNFNSKNRRSPDKILLLANSRISVRGGFDGIYKVFNRRYGQYTKEYFLDRSNVLIRLFCGYVDKKTSQEREIGLEHLLNYWNKNNSNATIRFIRKYGNALQEFTHQKKKEISDILDELIKNRENKTVEEVLKLMVDNELIVSKNYNNFLSRINQNLDEVDEERKKRIVRDKVFYEAFLKLPYKEILNFWKHVQEETVFSTKHGTKGNEFRNVLSVIDDTEWKANYNFDNFFGDNEEKAERKLRTRNLFYVECSRAQDNLIVLMLSKVSEGSLVNIRNWFGEENVIDVEEYLKN